MFIPSNIGGGDPLSGFNWKWAVFYLCAALLPFLIVYLSRQ